MSDLFRPGDARAGRLMSDQAFFAALVTVENAWLAVLVDSSIAPAAARADLTAVVGPDDAEAVARSAEGTGNAVPALVGLLRSRADGDTATWLHRGLTSQDVVDSAIMLCLRDARGAIAESLTDQVRILVDLIDRFGDAPVLTHTLTQPAIPGTAGARFAVWLNGILDAADGLAAVPALPVQVGGAAGTMAAVTELIGSPAAALDVGDALAEQLGLAPAGPWHTVRSPITRIGDALVTCHDAWGHLANDITIGSRNEVGEFAEGSGGGSSTMPQKHNPVLSVLIRSAALTAPGLGATLHAASAAQVDERADGGWHAEWTTVRTLARQAVVSASQTTDLLRGLSFSPERAATNLAAAAGIDAEQRSMSTLTGKPPGPTYLGAADLLVERTVQRARHHLEETA